MAITDSLIPVSEAQKPFFAGIDVGGTNTKIVLLDDQGSPLAFQKIASDPEDSAEAAAERFGTTVTRLVDEAGASTADVARVGLATPGTMDIAAGMLLTPGNLPNWWNFPIRDRVSHYCGLPVTYVNDANAAAYGEYWRGTGKQYRSMILLTLGTGIGGGIIVDDLNIQGEHSCGSECGHIIVDPSPSARRDSLNKTGSLEAYCGAYSVVGRTQEALKAGRESSLADHGESITPLAIAQHAERGDALAREIVLETAYYLGIGIVSMVHTIDPNSVVLGGAMSFGGAGHPLGEEFIACIRKEARSRMLEPLRDKVTIEFASLGGDAGCIGSAGMARLDHRRNA